VTTHLPYETKAGIASEDDAITQLTEKLREASELAYQASHINNAHQRTDRGEGFKQVGLRLEKMAQIVIQLATAGRH
jgi:hypothetical protein